MTMSLQSGVRKSEWAQDSASLRRSRDVARNVDGTSKAFIQEDLQFFGARGKHLRQDSRHARGRATQVDTRWRFQKNGDNGQEISYVKDTNNPHRCYVAAAQSVVSRAKRLDVEPSRPLAVYAVYPKPPAKQSIKEVKYITDVEINQVVREAAKAVYSIKCPKKLAKFSSHSFQVGACVILHAAGKDPEYIKFRLRWRSDSYRMYLRNIPELARQHLEALSTTLY